jgi:hypothetical protein
LINKGFLNTNTDITATTVNSENARSRIVASSAGKREVGAKEDESSNGDVWAAEFHRVTARSRSLGVLKLMNRLFNFPIFFGLR